MGRHWITIILALALIAGLVVLLDSPKVILPADDAGVEEPEAHLAGYLIDAVTTQYQEDGTVEYLFTAERLSRYQLDPNRATDADFTLIDSPFFIIYQQAGAPWQIRAEEGESRQNDELFILRGDVRAWQDDPERGHTDISTQVMHFRPQPQTAETDEFVMITQGRSRSQGYGMHADLAQETITILSEGNTVYERKP